MKAIFSDNADINQNAYMNWRTNRHDHLHNMNVIASGFANSSLVIVKQILENNNRGKQADDLIFPILFNANHAIEVYLKTINWSLNVLLEKDGTYSKTHNLQGLLKSVKELSEEQDDNFNFEHHYGVLNKYIDELYKKIEIQNDDGKSFSDITFARYTQTRDKKPQPQFYINELDNVIVDLPNFLEVFKVIFDKLDNMASYFQDCIEMKNEMESEYY
ncbi:hypothetical protein NSQ62_11790 [Solibacillus sp. FSL H8-0523]|uniref:hypothetical protein n=1 Tax=Solibacillus sp. FSL H8-0523 TaxID=2954511 RepID=UPI0031016FFE